MKRLYKILRTVAVSLISLVILVPAILYVLLSLPSVQTYICHRAEDELSKLLAVDVDIDFVQITPFNRVTLHGVKVSDCCGEKALTVDRLGAGMSMWDLVVHRKLVFNYAELIGMHGNIYRETPDSPLNIQPIIDALSPKDKNKPPTKFDFRINTVVIRKSSIDYNVRSEAETPGRFNANHISLNDLRADLILPAMRNDDFTIDLRRLAFAEQSGLEVDNLSGWFHVDAKNTKVQGLTLDMPGTHLAFGDMEANYDSFAALSSGITSMPLNIKLLEGSKIDPADFAAFCAPLGDLPMEMDVKLHVDGTLNELRISELRLESDEVAAISLKGDIAGLTGGLDSLRYDVPMLDVKGDVGKLVSIIATVVPIDEKIKQLAANAGVVDVKSKLSGTPLAGNVALNITSQVLDAAAETKYCVMKGAGHDRIALDGNIDVTNYDGAALMNGVNQDLAKLSSLSAYLDWDVVLGGKLPEGVVDVDLHNATYNGHEINDLTAWVENRGGVVNGTINVDNGDILSLDASAYLDMSGVQKSLQADIDLRHVDLCLLGLANHHDAHDLSMECRADIYGSDIDDVAGVVDVDNIRFVDNHGRGLMLDNLHIASMRGVKADSLILTSAVVDGKIKGRYHFRSLPVIAKAILAQTLPALINDTERTDEWWMTPGNQNDLTYRFVVKTLDPLKNMVKLPVDLLDNVILSGAVDSRSRTIDVDVNAPYLLQGNKIIEGSKFTARIGAGDTDNNAHGLATLSTKIPTKKGPMTLSLNAQAANNNVDAHLQWKIDRERDFSGQINTSAQFDRPTHGSELISRIGIDRSRVVFNDTVWTIDPSTIVIHGKDVAVDDFRAWHGRQYISINGRASEQPNDTLVVELEDINLDYVFETLDIPTAMFGGDATGRFYASEIFTSTPKAYTPLLKVKNLTYNYSLMGNANIRSSWNGDKKAVSILAEILQPNGRKSYVDGEIFPMADSLDMRFDADRIEVGFLLPYMSAFATGISGYATGKARLWGTFKLIDMVGDVYGENVALTLGFTNTTYTTTDSVRLRPGRIDLNNLTIRDKNGKTAKLNGWLTHECFKLPRFNFTISDAKDLLVYDVKENAEHPWYGRVYGNGGATVSGYPGVVDIGVTMATAPGSSFTYILSDALNAQEYNFITFRDRNQASKDSIAALNAPPVQVLEAQRRIMNNNDLSAPSEYRMNFNIDITPDALITLVMDPVGGDRIKAYGSGNLLMAYDSSNEDLRMNGTYTVERGSYNFTLQDIIIKDFTINDGSKITFNGDPYAAQLDLTALYHLKANLTDLDESFLEDKELNRTNVPVDAQLIVKGDMRQPEISFDLDFPTLTQDTKRKVRSIINTEEMMNRQIIYLLALNRFYTPDYMNATRGNEFVSVASSTISSQLGNILGQISDNWNIAPNFRSDKGDFSDMEFDLALSSNLLNNRLLLNGNLGYRDKSLNNNSFIGDFDIEYLLNRTGSIRLKAYNRYNDQNFYVKNALTTQGVGIVFKRDFDDLRDVLRSLLHRRGK